MIQKKREVGLIVGGGPGISASCARLFTSQGMKVAVAARNPEKSALKSLESEYAVTLYQCDATDKDAVQKLFEDVETEMGPPRLVVHNIDGRVPEIFRKDFIDAAPELVLQTMKNGAFSAFLIGQHAAKSMLGNEAVGGHRGTIIFTNATAAFEGRARSGAFAMSCQAKSGLAQSMARELMPQGIHVAHVPIDAAIGWQQEDGSRWHRLAGTTENDNMADPERIAETYLQLHRQHRSTWAFEVILRPWVEDW